MNFCRRSNLLLLLLACCASPPPREMPPGARLPQGDDELRFWLTNMIVQHRYSREEVHAATGLTLPEIDDAVRRLGVSAPLPGKLLPYPGGRHPRIGFLDGAVDPQRETKFSVFTPWDPASYVVVDVPEAVFTQHGLTYLAHKHVPTLWTKQGIELKKTEWERGPGWLRSRRRLPNGISIGVLAQSTPEGIRMELWLHNGTAAKLTGMRVQNCVLLRGAAGFNAQTKDNKLQSGPYAACRSEDGKRWIITAWDPLHRSWVNPPCPCMHSDPVIPDCEPGEIKRVMGWLSFYEGADVQQELQRLDGTDWKAGPRRDKEPRAIRGSVYRIEGKCASVSSADVIPCRVYIRDSEGRSWHATGVPYSKTPANRPHEVHTSVSGPIEAKLPAGLYSITVERGKEYQTISMPLEVTPETETFAVLLPRWINCAELGWFSGETHVHRDLKELPTLMLAEDLNVAFPLTWWVTRSGMSPRMGDKSAKEEPPAAPVYVDRTHVYYPRNTEYEIFSVEGKSHTLGAFFVLNHKGIFEAGVPPVRPIFEKAEAEGALLELDKHNWPWSMALVPLMKEGLYELANNHMWRSGFGFTQFGEAAAPYMKIEMGPGGFTERGWIDFGFLNYYALLNCGFRLQPTAGSASGVHPVPLGFGRVYVHLPDGFSYEKWVDGLRRGRSFVTTGPMLFATVNGKDAGERFKGAGSYRVAGRAVAPHPIQSIEVVVNGDVARTIAPSKPGNEIAFDETLAIDASSWIALRCFEARPDGRPRFAHTAPFHVEVEGRPLRPTTDQIEYLIRRVGDQINRSEGVLPPAALDEYRQAREILRAIGRTAR